MVNKLNQINTRDVVDLDMIQTSLHDNTNDSLISIIFNLAQIFCRHHINEENFEPAGCNYITDRNFIINQYHKHNSDYRQEYQIVMNHPKDYFWFISKDNQITPLNVNNLTKLSNDLVYYLYRIHDYFSKN